MKPRTAKSMELYDVMLKRGYPKEFCEQITLNLNTDWTATRMLGYLSHYNKLPMEEVADEMLAILSDRNRIMQKHEMEETNIRKQREKDTGWENGFCTVPRTSQGD